MGEFLYSLTYVMQRGIVIFLTIIITFSPTPPNIIIVVIIFFMNLKNRNFGDNIGIMCILGAIILVKSIILKFIIVDFLKLAVQRTNADIINEGALTYWLLKFLNFDKRTFIFAAGFFICCNVFIVINILIAKVIFINMNVVKLKKRSIFWRNYGSQKLEFTQEQRNSESNYSQTEIIEDEADAEESREEADTKRARNFSEVLEEDEITAININHKKWAEPSGSFVIWARDAVFIYPLELYFMFMILLIYLAAS